MERKRLKQSYLSLQEAALFLHISEEELLSYIMNGSISAVKSGEGHQIRTKEVLKMAIKLKQVTTSSSERVTPKGRLVFNPTCDIEESRNRVRESLAGKVPTFNDLDNLFMEEMRLAENESL